jgi:hypothetical protein
MTFKKNDPVWVSIRGKKYRGFYHGSTMYELKHWVKNKPQVGMGAGWCVDAVQITARNKCE